MNVVVVGQAPTSMLLFRRELLRAMSALGHRVTACAERPVPRVVDSLAAMGVAFRAVPFDRTGSNPIRDLRALQALFALFRELRPDAVLSYTLKPVIYGSLAARLAGVPRIYSMIEGAGYAFSSTGAKRSAVRQAITVLYRLSLARNRRVFFLNPDDQKRFHELGLTNGAEQSILLNGIGVDLAEFTPAPFKPPIRFLLMGRLLRDKGIAEFAEAARRIRAMHPQVGFALLGGMDDRHPATIRGEELRAWTEAGTLEYLGTLQDVRPAIADASVFVLPSYYPEGLPRSIMEAMAMGRPIITTDAPGCRETVEPGRNGYLVPVRDVAALVAAMERFIEHPEQIATMGRESRRIAETKFDVLKVNQVILDAMELT